MPTFQFLLEIFDGRFILPVIKVCLCEGYVGRYQVGFTLSTIRPTLELQKQNETVILMVCIELKIN